MTDQDAWKFGILIQSFAFNLMKAHVKNLEKKNRKLDKTTNKLEKFKKIERKLWKYRENYETNWKIKKKQTTGFE